MVTEGCACAHSPGYSPHAPRLLGQPYTAQLVASSLLRHRFLRPPLPPPKTPLRPALTFITAVYHVCWLFYTALMFIMKASFYDRRLLLVSNRLLTVFTGYAKSCLVEIALCLFTLLQGLLHNNEFCYTFFYIVVTNVTIIMGRVIFVQIQTSDLMSLPGDIHLWFKNNVLFNQHAHWNPSGKTLLILELICYCRKMPYRRNAFPMVMKKGCLSWSARFEELIILSVFAQELRNSLRCYR